VAWVETDPAASRHAAAVSRHAAGRENRDSLPDPAGAARLLAYFSDRFGAPARHRPL